MTSPRDVDELASALLDGLLDAEAADAARRDPAVAGRAAEMRAAREAVRRVPPPDPARRDAAIAAALDAAAHASPPPAADPDAAAPWASSASDAGQAGVLGTDPHAVDQPLAEAATTAAGWPGPASPQDRDVRPGADARPDPHDGAPAGGADAVRSAAYVPPDPGAAGGLDDAPAAPPPTPPSAPPSPGHAGPSHGPAAGAPPGGPVVPLAGRKRRWADPRWLGAAAAVVAILAIGAVVAGQSSSDSQDTAANQTADRTTGEAAPSPSTTPDAGSGGHESGGAGSAQDEGGDATAAAPGEAAPEAADPELPAEAPGPVVDFGEVGSDEALARRVGAALDGVGAFGDADRSGDGGASRCSDPLDADSGPLVLRGRAKVDGQAVEVWVHDDGPTRRMAVTDESCTVVSDERLPD